MNQYKVVKRDSYEFIYDIYIKIFCFWKHLGYISSPPEDDNILKKAKQLVCPKTLYFSE